MIPLKDENPTRTFPFVTITLIILNTLVFIHELRLGEQLEAAIMRYGVIPYRLIYEGSFPVWETLFTSLFLHGGVTHLAGNMLYLWVFGNNIEDRLGHMRFIAFYLLCGIAASFGQVAANPSSQLPMIGASGSISGVLGAYLLLYPRAKVLVLLPFFYIWRIIKVNAKWFLVFWILLQFLYGTTSYMLMDAAAKGGVAWFAHIAGFFSGIVLLKILIKR